MLSNSFKWKHYQRMVLDPYCEHIPLSPCFKTNKSTFFNVIIKRSKTISVLLFTYTLFYLRMKLKILNSVLYITLSFFYLSLYYAFLNSVILCHIGIYNIWPIICPVNAKKVLKKHSEIQ
jgi:hypothetical protein